MLIHVWQYTISVYPVMIYNAERHHTSSLQCMHFGTPSTN